MKKLAPGVGGALGLGLLTMVEVASAQPTPTSPPPPTEAAPAESSPSPPPTDAAPPATPPEAPPGEARAVLSGSPPAATATPAAPTRGEAAPVDTAPAPEARAAETAGASAPTFDPILLVHVEYVFSLRSDAADEQAWFHEIELPRAQAGLGVAWEAARGKVLLEAVRSSSEGALVGVAGDSLVARFREAWLGADGWDVLEVRAGLIPTLILPALEESFALRAIAPTALERAALVSPADLGLSARARLPEAWGWVGVAAANGDGYTRRELNRGKNVEVAAEIHPLAFSDAAAPFAVLASYTAGSTGVGLARSNRLTGGLAWQGAWLRAGGAATWAEGIADDGERQGLALEAFVKVADLEPIPWLIVGADLAVFLRDVEAGGDRITTITGAVGARIAPPLRTYLAADAAAYGDVSAAALPGRDDARLRLVGELSL